MAQSRHSKSASQHSRSASQHSKAESPADPAPAPANVPAPAQAPPPAQLALFSTLASAAKLLLEALGNRDLKADNHFTLETLRRAIRVSETYIEIVLRELERHEISTQAGPSRSRQDGKRASKPESKSNSLLRVLPKIISIAAQLAKTREKRPNGSVRLTLLQELYEFLRVEIKAARKEVKRLEHVLEGKHKRPRHRRHRAEKGRGGRGEGKNAITAGGEGGQDEGGNGDGDGDGGEDDDDDDEDGSDGDGDDDGAPLLRRGPTSLNEATSNGGERQSAGPSGDESSQHNDDRALVIRVQSPSTHRSERVSSRASYMAASKSSRSGSHDTGSVASKTPSSRHIVEEAPIAARSRSRSKQRTERLSGKVGPVEVPPSPHPASSHPRSIVSRKSSSRHIVEKSSAVKSQSYSTRGFRRVSNSTASELASSPLHPGSDHTKSIASRCPLKPRVVDQPPAARHQSRSTQRTDAGSNRDGSVKAAPSSRHESIGPSLVVSKDLSSRQVEGQARSRSPSAQKSERASDRTSPELTSKSSSQASNHARSIISRASSKRRVVKQESIAGSRSPSTQRVEDVININAPVHYAGGQTKSIVSRASSIRHVVDKPALFNTQRPSPGRKGQASDLSGPVRVTSNASRSISSGASSSRHVTDQQRVTGIQSPGPEETKERASNVSCSVRHRNNYSKNLSSGASSRRQVVHQPPVTDTQSQNTQERTNNATDSVRHANNNSRSVSSKASSSHHSRVTRAPTVSTSSSRSSSPSSTVANVDDSRAQRSRQDSASRRSHRAVQSSCSSASHRSQPRSKVSSPAPSEQHTAFPKPEPSGSISVHAIEKEKPSLTLRISDIHDGRWTFQQLHVNNEGESWKSKISKGFCENLT